MKKLFEVNYLIRQVLQKESYMVACTKNTIEILHYDGSSICTIHQEGVIECIFHVDPHLLIGFTAKTFFCWSMQDGQEQWRRRKKGMGKFQSILDFPLREGEIQEKFFIPHDSSQTFWKGYLEPNNAMIVIKHNNNYVRIRDFEYPRYQPPHYISSFWFSQDGTKLIFACVGCHAIFEIRLFSDAKIMSMFFCLRGNLSLGQRLRFRMLEIL